MLTQEKGESGLQDFLAYLTGIFSPDIDPSSIGYADVSTPLSDLMGVIEVLAPWPKSYPLLGNSFDDLHPIMLGPQELCLRVRKVLGDSVSTRKVGAATALLWIPRAILVDPNAKQRAQAFLVPRDHTTAAGPLRHDASLGEHELGARVFYTARRWRQLSEKQLVPHLEGYTYESLIQPKYCRLLGIDPEEILVDFFQTASIKPLLAKIDTVFSELPQSIPLDERILRAHKQVLGRPHVSPDEFQELWGFLRKRLVERKTS